MKWLSLGLITSAYLIPSPSSSFTVSRGTTNKIQRPVHTSPNVSSLGPPLSPCSATNARTNFRSDVPPTSAAYVHPYVRAGYGPRFAFERGENGVGNEGPGGRNGPILLAEKSLNRVSLIGRVGVDPDVRQISTGDKMASFALATNEQWRDRSTGEVRTRTDWHRIVIFDPGLVELIEKFVHKGRRLLVEGALQTRRWISADGQERYTTEVVLAKYRGEMVLLDNPDEKRTGGMVNGINVEDSRYGVTRITDKNGVDPKDRNRIRSGN